MYTNNFKQLTIFIYFILTGIVLSIIFDVFRIIRKSFKTSDFITNIQDLLFGVITGIILLCSIFLFNNGEIRLYIFIGIIFGSFFYMLFISKHFIKINVEIINFLKKIIILITKPFRILFKFIRKLILKHFSFIFINLKHLFKKTFNYFKKTTKFNKKMLKKKDFE